MVGVGDGSDLAPETWMGSGLDWCQGTELGKQLSDQGRADCLCCPFPFRLWHKLTHVHTLISSPPPSPSLAHTRAHTHTCSHTCARSVTPRHHTLWASSYSPPDVWPGHVPAPCLPLRPSSTPPDSLRPSAGIPPTLDSGSSRGP